MVRNRTDYSEIASFLNFNDCLLIFLFQCAERQEFQNYLSSSTPLGDIHFLRRRPRGEGGLAKFLLYQIALFSIIYKGGGGSKKSKIFST